MSEEILKALMQLFAIIAKQDDGVEDNERQFVINFLTQQINDEVISEYISLFDKKAGLTGEQKPEKEKKKKLTSVKDSVRILGICKKINKTLTQQQKVIVLVRLFELINADRKFSEQRMAIINTVAEVFKLEHIEFQSIENFVINNDISEFNNPNLLIINDKKDKYSNCKHIITEALDTNIFILKISSVDLYFLRYTGNEDLFLNGLPVNNKKIYLFASGGSIKLPKGKPIYYSDIVAHYLADSSQIKISYKAHNLEFQFPNGTKGLRNINFSEEQGRLIGLMGASGAGKTTLLNVLCGLSEPSKGEVIINGNNLHTEKENLEGIIGYIPQDDLLIEELTVFQNLYYNAKFCFDDKSKEEIIELVYKTLTNLGLYDRKDLKVGSPLNKLISGGQRKRLNIALELIREPSILFVDEPTSGLSSRDSENVMDLLRELVLKGKLIFVVIHQPSSDIYKMFDNMMILDTGGYQIYYGNPVEAVKYFKKIDAQINSEVGECPTCGNVNPELIFNIIEAKVVDEYGKYTPKRKISAKKWNEHFENNIVLDKIEDINKKPPSSLKIPSWFSQFKIYTIRDFLSKISNKQYIALNLLEAPILAFILSFIIRYIANPNSNIYIFRENENIPIYIFMALIVALFLGLTISAEEIFRDRKILKREAFLNLSKSSYLVSKIIILFSISAIQSIFFVLIANNILGVYSMTFEYWIALFSTAAFANMLGLNISASFNSAVTIYILIPLLMIPMMTLSGAMFPFNKLNKRIGSIDKVPLLAEFMPTKWSYEALLVNQFKNNEFEKTFFDIEKQISNADYKTVYYLPELEKRLNYIENNDYKFNQDKEVTKTISNYLILLKKEIIKEQNRTNIQFAAIHQLDTASYNDIVTSKALNYIEKLNTYYKLKFEKATTKKDNIINYLMEKNPKLYNSKRNAFHNESVSDQVKKVYEKNKILEYNNELVQQIDLIFLDPDPNGFLNFRSHFLAPRKYFFGRYWDTFYFNLAFIWFLTILLYVILYFDGLKRLLTITEKIKFQKLNFKLR